MSEKFLDVLATEISNLAFSLTKITCKAIDSFANLLYFITEGEEYPWKDDPMFKCLRKDNEEYLCDEYDEYIEEIYTSTETKNIKKYEYIPTESFESEFIKNKDTKVYQYVEGDKEGVSCIIGVDIINDLLVKFNILNGHAMVGGASRWGKSNFLNVFITGTMLTYTPNEVMFLGCDYKKSDIYYFRNFEHFRGMATNKKEFITLIKALEKEMEKRADILDKANCRNVIKYNKVSDKKLSYIVFIIDELVLLANDKSEPTKVDCKMLLHSVMAKSASYGIYFILASQDFTKETIGKCKMNCSQTVGFHTKDKTDSETIIGKDYNLHEITERGRCKIDTNGEVTEAQIYYIEEEEMENLLKPYRKVKIVEAKEGA